MLLGGRTQWTVGLVATLISISSVIAADTFAFAGGKVIFAFTELSCCCYSPFPLLIMFIVQDFYGLMLHLQFEEEYDVRGTCVFMYFFIFSLVILHKKNIHILGQPRCILYFSVQSWSLKENNIL